MEGLNGLISPSSGTQPASPAPPPPSRRSWLHRWLYGEEGEEVRLLKHKVNLLEAALDLARLENELLGEVNEAYRQQVLKVIAAGQQAQGVLGVPEHLIGGGHRRGRE